MYGPEPGWLVCAAFMAEKKAASDFYSGKADAPTPAATTVEAAARQVAAVLVAGTAPQQLSSSVLTPADHDLPVIINVHMPNPNVV